MGTVVRYVDGVPVEEKTLDVQGRMAQKEISDAIYRQYTETGELHSVKLCERLAEYEEYAGAHVSQDDGESE